MAYVGFFFLVGIMALVQLGWGLLAWINLRDKTCSQFKTRIGATIYLTAPIIHVGLGLAGINSSPMSGLPPEYPQWFGLQIAICSFIIFILQILANVEVTEAGAS